MQAKFAPIIAAEKATWAPAEGDKLLPALRDLFEPIARQSDLICDGIGYPVGLVMTPAQFIEGSHRQTEIVVLDFPNRIVREPKEGEGKYRYGFRIATEIVRTVLRDNEPDWVNTIFLSTRFTTWRASTSTCTHSSNASPTNASPTPTAGSPKRTTTTRRSVRTAGRFSALSRA